MTEKLKPLTQSHFLQPGHGTSIRWGITKDRCPLSLLVIQAAELNIGTPAPLFPVFYGYMFPCTNVRGELRREATSSTAGLDHDGMQGGSLV